LHCKVTSNVACKAKSQKLTLRSIALFANSASKH
jgi:hypothetical protein